MADWKENKQEKIEKYNKWKKENPKEYERIIKEINIIIDDYKI
jgi:hypothetical protein